MATGGIALNGTTQYLELNSAVLTSFPCSLVIWCSYDTNQNMFPMSQQQSSADRDMSIFLDANGTSKYARMRNPGNSSNGTKSTSPHPSAGSLQIAVAVFTSASSRKMYYGDATPSSADTTSLTDDLSSHDRITIGALHSAGSAASNFHDGVVAEAHLFNVALSDANVTTLLTTPPEDVTGWVDGWILSSNSDLTSIGGTRTLTAVGSPTTGSLTLPYTRSAPAPTLSSPSAGTPASTSCAISATTDSLSDGTIYYLARVGGSAAVAATIIATGQSQAVSASNPQTRTVTGLTAATASNYVDVVQVGTGGNSNVVTAGPFTTAASGDTTAPTLSGSIVIGTVSSTTIQISWSAGSDNIAVTSYEVSSSGGSSYTDVGNVLTYTFTGLTPSTSYGLRVRAKDAAGNVSSPAISSTQSTAAASGVGSISLNNAALYVFKRNNTTTIPSTAVTFWVSDITSGALIGTAITGLSTNSSGLVTTSISNASMTAGVTYRLNYEFGTGEYGVVKLPAV